MRKIIILLSIALIAAASAGCADAMADAKPASNIESLSTAVSVKSEQAQSDAAQKVQKAESAATNAGAADTIISQDEAVNIALSHAGVASSETSMLHVKLDYDDGIQVYEIEFYVGNTEYDYEIKAADGTICSYDMEIEEPWD